jgi:hypothetical protein
MRSRFFCLPAASPDIKKPAFHYFLSVEDRDRRIPARKGAAGRHRAAFYSPRGRSIPPLERFPIRLARKLL